MSTLPSFDHKGCVRWHWPKPKRRDVVVLTSEGGEIDVFVRTRDGFFVPIEQRDPSGIFA